MRKFIVLLLVVLSVFLLVTLVLLQATGLLRPVYFAARTEWQLMRRGEPFARIRIAPRDRMNQVYIPTGQFLMGASPDEQASAAPGHQVHLKGYWIDQFAVTNAMYNLCVKDGKCRHTQPPDTWLDDPAYADYPVRYVNWWDAQRFCLWEGGRLPTEAEWEKAARGPQGFRYPWGEAQPAPGLLNYNSPDGAPRSAYDYWAGMSPYGLLNMAGNVQQWVADWYGSAYYEHAPYADPAGPAGGRARVLRGGSYADDERQVQSFFRSREEPGVAAAHSGIRCAQDDADAKSE